MRKGEFVQSCAYCILITVLLGAAALLKYISLKYLLYGLSVWVWPVLLLSDKMLCRYKYKHPILLSLIGWGSCSIVLVIINLLKFEKIWWCVFPVIGIFLWPLSTIIKMKAKEGEK